MARRVTIHIHVAYSAIPTATSFDSLKQLLETVGATLIYTGFCSHAGPFAVALNTTSETLALLAAIAPRQGTSLN